MNIKRIINEEMLQPKSVPTSHHLSESKNINENEWDWAINSKPTWSTYYTSLLNEIKKLPNNLEDVTLKMLEPIWMRLSTTNKLLKKGVEPQEIDTDLAIEYMIDDPWPDKKVLLPDNDAIDIIENLFIRLMRVVEGGTENSNGKKYNDAYMTSQQSIYTSTKLTLITYINGLISQLTLINESEDDFDWAKETNPIQCKDLKGYYFYYGTDPRKFIIGGVSINSGDELKVHYKWYDQHSNKDDWGKMGCDTLIHRVKLGSYNLYDTDDKEVNQRDLAYTDNTFDDDVRKEIWEQGELDWVKDTPLVTIGGKNGYPKESVPLGTKVISRVGEVFTIEDITGGHMDFQHVWGREISPAWVGPKNDDDNKNWHNALWLRRATPKDLNESDDEWEWAKTTQPIELENPKDWVGRSFRYGQEIIDQMSDDEINTSHDEEYFTITGIDENGNLTLIKNHPIYGENHDSSTSPRNLRDYISKDIWVWI